MCKVKIPIKYKKQIMKMFDLRRFKACDCTDNGYTHYSDIEYPFCKRSGAVCNPDCPFVPFKPLDGWCGCVEWTMQIENGETIYLYRGQAIQSKEKYKVWKKEALKRIEWIEEVKK